MDSNEELLRQLAGMVSSFLGGGNRPKSNLHEIDGVKHRLELNGATTNQIQLFIQAGRDRSPNRRSAEATIITQKYLQRYYLVLVPGGKLAKVRCPEAEIDFVRETMNGHVVGEGATEAEALRDMRG